MFFFKYLIIRVVIPLFSAVKLNDPVFIRKSQAAACFKKFDPDLRGAIHADCFPHVYTMLVQLELISAKATVTAAMARLDPERKQVVCFADFLNWVEQVCGCACS